MDKKRILFISALMADDMYTFSGLMSDIVGGEPIKRELRSHVRSLGGNAITFTCAQRLGFQSVPMGMVGTDDIGKFFLETMKAEGITLEAVQVEEDYVTPMVMVLIDSEKKHNYLYISRKRLNEVIDPDTTVAACDYMYMCGFSLSTEAGNEDNPERTLSFARSAKKQGKPIFFDPGPMFDVMPKEVWQEAFKLADYNVLNEVEAEIVTGISDPTEAAFAMVKEYGGICVVKAGAAGSVVCDGETATFTKSFSVPVVNTNGAGDTFIAGFMLGLDKGLSLADSAVVGTAAAAIKVSRGGASNTTPNYDEVKAFLTKEGFANLL